MSSEVQIPNRKIFKSAEVCSIAKVQAYVLKSWETEFPGLGMPKGKARVYRRADVETVLEIKRLLYEEGLTLGAARRRLGEVGASVDEQSDGSVDELLTEDAKSRIEAVTTELKFILNMLGNGSGVTPDMFETTESTELKTASEPTVPEVEPEPPKPRKKRAAAVVRKKKTTKKKGR